MYLTKAYAVSSRVNGICSVNLMGRISAQDANSLNEQASVHLFNVNSHAFCLHSILIHCAKNEQCYQQQQSKKRANIYIIQPVVRSVAEY